MNTRLAFWGPIQTVTMNMMWQGKGWQRQRCSYWQRSNWNAYFNWQMVGCGMNFAYQMGLRKYLIGPHKLVITWHSNPYHHFSNWPCIGGKNHFTFDETEVSRNMIWLTFPCLTWKEIESKIYGICQEEWGSHFHESLFISYILETFSPKHLKNYGLNKVREPIKNYYSFTTFQISLNLFTTICN